MMIKSTKSPEDAWDFIKWWVSADAQKRFAMEMETVLGQSAKQPVANLEAFKGLSWSSRDLTGIMDQWEHTVGIPQVPGGYMTQRNVEFAFARVYNAGETPSETLLDYILPINKELSRKRREFGLAVGEAQ
jgi:ABC-type glycerol-3-phosphate transport system substrate-binding protein